MVIQSELEILSRVDAGFNLFEESAKPDQRNMTDVLSVKRICGLAPPKPRESAKISSR
jgi:hypothetical protein